MHFGSASQRQDRGGVRKRNMHYVTGVTVESGRAESESLRGEKGRRKLNQHDGKRRSGLPVPVGQSYAIDDAKISRLGKGRVGREKPCNQRGFLRHMPGAHRRQKPLEAVKKNTYGVVRGKIRGTTVWDKRFRNKTRGRPEVTRKRGGWEKRPTKRQKCWKGHVQKQAITKQNRSEGHKRWDRRKGMESPSGGSAR